jgi:hypothetical protein
MNNSKVNESLDEEVQYVKTVSHRRDSEVLWIKTQEARATSPNVISNNEKVSIKTEVVNSNIIEHKKPISKSGTRLTPLNKLTNVNGMLTPWRGVSQKKIILPTF